jgi:hypothetical protein
MKKELKRGVPSKQDILILFYKVRVRERERHPPEKVGFLKKK